MFAIKETCIQPIAMNTPMCRTVIKQSPLFNWAETDVQTKSAFQNFSSKVSKTLDKTPSIASLRDQCCM